MLTKGSVKYTWTQGRKLASVDNGKKIQYFYDHTGNRTKKVVDGVTTQFRMARNLLASERRGTEKTLWYRYDSSGNVMSVTYNGTLYIYVRNLQNDIIAIIDGKGNEVVGYTYDSWGKVTEITGSMKDTIGERNPFRYRGYYYDTETEMYYLKSRYYDPEIRRFISADTLMSNSINGMNLFKYYPGIGKLNNIWSIKRNMVVSTNGFHCGVEYNGVTYCNIHPQGLLTLEWLIDFEGFGEPKVNYIPF